MLKNLKRQIFSMKGRNFITIVSGLPRSGTSMMMKMLEAGGMAILTDGIRKADEDNPRGYYEFEGVKKIKKDKSWLPECKGKAVKMVSMLLYDLPSDYKYKIIFMQRDMQEMLASQAKMLERLGRKGGDVSDEEMAEKYEKHLKEIGGWLSQQNNMNVLYVRYNDVIKESDVQSARVNRFLGGFLNEEEMARVVEPGLYRQRKSSILNRDSDAPLDKRIMTEYEKQR